MRTISDERLREDYTKERNNDAISKRQISDGLSQKLRSGLGRYFGSDMRRESGTELPVDSRKSGNNGRGIDEQVAGKDYKNGIDTDTEIADIWANALSSSGGNSGSYLSRDEYGGRATSDDSLSDDAPRRNRTGNSERNGRDYKNDSEELKEIIPKLISF